MTGRNKDIIWGICLMALSVVFFALSYQFPAQTLSFSPKIFPRFVCVCLFLLSAFLFGQGVAAKQGTAPDKQSATDVNWAFVTRLSIVILTSYAYTWLLPVFGYVVVSPFFIAGIMLLFKEKNWVKIATTAVMTTAILYILFRIVFKVPLPRSGFF